MKDAQRIGEYDRQYVWHPYTRMGPDADQVFVVRDACGPWLDIVVEGQSRQVIDAMSSWWTAIHGYRHPVLTQAAHDQLNRFSHVMFGGLTHQPAAELAHLLATITPGQLERVFFSDSGSVAIEVAAKMAWQYWHARGQGQRRQLMSWRGGYHGDTFTPMSVCDPDQGMHHLWAGMLPKHLFAPVPPVQYDHRYSEQFEKYVCAHRDHLAAIIVEPVVQGAGGMRFHDPQYLADLRRMSTDHEVLLIFDEIATGFGRTGELFAANHAQVSPDIMCVGKALTGGMVGLAATLCTPQIADTISTSNTGALMHGPTFMANPLACAISLANVELLLDSPWQHTITRIQQCLSHELEQAWELAHVREVRVRGGIGVIEMDHRFDIAQASRIGIDHHVWLRPFGHLIYTMPPYICTDEELRLIGMAMVEVARGVL